MLKSKNQYKYPKTLIARLLICFIFELVLNS